MNKEDLLKQIADTAYNVGFGAKKHFATYDIVEKIPGIIGFSSIAIGIFGLVYDCLSTKGLSALFLVLGITEFYIGRYNETVDQFARKGEELTKLYQELKSLYYEVKSASDDGLSQAEDTLADITKRYYSNCLSKQILFSDWCAHYKFFWQHQIDWIDEQKHFRFWRDKVPLSLSLFVLVFVIITITYSISCFIC